MRKYTQRATSAVRIAYGRELLYALRIKADTAPLAAALEPVQAALEARLAERTVLEDTVAQARVALRFADYALDRALRTTRRQAELIDGGRVGPLTEAIFPEGVTAETAPVGERQEKRARALLARVQELSGAAAESLRAQGLAALSEAVQSFAEARARHEDARTRAGTAFASEQLVRDDHRTQIDRIIGQVLALYPNDRAMRDLLFPEVRVSEPAEEEDEAQPSA